MGRLLGFIPAALAIVAVLLLSAPASTAAADTTSGPSGDPASDTYSPWVWLQAWGTAGAVDAARAGDTTEGLQHSGMIVAAVPDQLNALTAADKTQLDTAWKAGGLLALTYQRVQEWSAKAFANTGSVPAWSTQDSDSVAGDLGGASYAALSPGLKSVVQRIATIVTGDTKPAMPDEAWSSWMSPQVKAGFDARPDTRFDWSTVTQTPPGVAADPASQVTTQCDAGLALNWLCHATQAAVGAVTAAVDFVTNPLGYLAAAFSAAAAGLMTFVANVANHGTTPDLTASWWISAYTKGFAIGVVLLGFVLLYETVQVARRKTSGDELVETIAIWVPAWFAGVLFGPPLAQFLITGASYLTDGIVSSMTGYGAGDAFTAVAQATKDGAQVQQAGELVMALLSAIAVLVSALLVFISLCVQAVIIYLASAVFAVGWVWIVTARHRETAWRIPRLFIGIVFSKALLFFLLGVAMAIATASTAMTGDGLAKNLGLIVMACAAMLLAAFAPLMLLRHAPVIPGTSTSRDVGDSMAGAGAAAGRAVRGGRPAAMAGASKLSALAGQSRTGGSGKAGTVVGNAGRPSTWGGSGASGSGSSGGSASSAAAVSGTAGAGRPGRPNPAATRSSTASSSGPSGKQPRSGRPAGHPGPGRRSTDAGAAPSPVPVGPSAGSRGGTSSSTSRDHAAAGSAVAGAGTGTRRAPDPAPTPGSASGTRSLTEGLRATPAPPAPPAPVSPRPGEAR